MGKGRLKFDVGDLRQLAAETGKFEMLVTNFPHNPTGACLNESEMREVASVAHAYDAWLFSDEMYRGLGAHLLHGMRYHNAELQYTRVVGQVHWQARLHGMYACAPVLRAA